jgi:hypothetical protein
LVVPLRGVAVAAAALGAVATLAARTTRATLSGALAAIGGAAVTGFGWVRRQFQRPTLAFAPSPV